MMLDQIDKSILEYWGKSIFPSNSSLSFCGTDSETLFKKNSKFFSQYMEKFKDLKYIFNEYGYRSDNFSKLCEILFNGCSHTMGIGLPQENTYGHIISKKLSIPYHSIAMSGSDISLSVARSLYWIPKLKPKIHVFQKPNINRIGYFTKEKNDHFITSVCDNWNNPSLLYNVNLYWNYYSSIKTLEDICKEYNVKLYCFNFTSKETDHFWNKNRYLARDLLHFGYEPNKVIADIHMKNIENLL